MKLQKKTLSAKKKLLIAATVAVIVAAGSVGLMALYKVGPFKQQDSSVNLDKPTNDQKKAGDSTKKNAVDSNTGNKGTASGSDPLPAPTPAPSGSGGKPTIGAEITAANQDTSMYHVRALIQTVSNTGTCTLSMSGPDGKSYTATVDVQALPSSSTCKGFDIPLSSLLAGSWTVSLSFANDTYTASTSKTVTVQ